MKKLYTLLTAIALGAIPQKVLAAAHVLVIPEDNPLGPGPTVGQLITNTVNILAFVSGVVCVIAIMIGGIMYTTSAGDATRLKTAKDTILYALIGMAVSISAFAIASFVNAQLTAP